MKTKKLKIRSIFYILFLFVFSLTIVSCESDIERDSSQYTVNSWGEYFDAYWTTMDKYYMFWEYDPTNWDAIYDTYKPLFYDLKIEKGNKSLNKESFEKAVDYLKEITIDLIDGHYSLTVYPLGLHNPLDVRGVRIRPTDERYKKNKNYRDRLEVGYLSRTLPFSYLLSDGSLKIKRGGSFYHVLGSFKNDNSIKYYSFSAFSLVRWYEGYKEDRDILDFLINSVINNPSTKGIIIDLRSNAGGSLRDQFFIRKFITKPLTVGSAGRKWGFGRYDFTPYVPVTISPDENSLKTPKPIVVLMDSYSVSMSEFMISVLSLEPNVTLIGETSHGGFSYTKSRRSGPYSGIYMSDEQFIHADGKIYEGKGIHPDIEVILTPTEVEQMNKAGETMTRDKQMEKAIEVIKKNSL